MVSNTFTREHIEAMRPKLMKTIDQSIDYLIAARQKQLPVDLVANFALLVPTLVSVLKSINYRALAQHDFLPNNQLLSSLNHLVFGVIVPCTKTCRCTDHGVQYSKCGASAIPSLRLP
eukprot:19238-Heterococcus_DN1.PRE.2